MDDEAAQQLVNEASNGQDDVWTGGPVTLARGRSAKDPNAVTSQFSVSTLEDFEESLKNYLSTRSPENAEHEEAQFSFWIGASFLVYPPGVSNQERVASEHQQQVRDAAAAAQQRGSQHQHQHQHQQEEQQQSFNLTGHDIAQDYAPAGQSHTRPQPQQQPPQTRTPSQDALSTTQQKLVGDPRVRVDKKVSMSIMEALQPSTDSKDRMRKQRAIAKACVDVIQKVDGYRYSFHNNWKSREDDAFRFSYYCNDSLLNKDRAANGKGQKLGKRATKPVYDCKGVLAVKFSANKQSLEVHYKHVPKHKTYEERAPPPRRDSKRRKWYEENDPDGIPPLKWKRRDPSDPPKEKKAKRVKATNATNSIESDLRTQSLQMLLSLIRTDNPISDRDTLNAAISQAANPPIPPLPENAPSTPAGPPLKRRPRSSCTECRGRKTKCDSGLPNCRNCVEYHRTCVYMDVTEDVHRRQSMPAPQGASASDVAQAIRIPDDNSNALTSVPTNTQKPTDNPMDPMILEMEKMRAELAAARRELEQLKSQQTASPATATPAGMMSSMTPPTTNPSAVRAREPSRDTNGGNQTNVAASFPPQFQQFQTPTPAQPQNNGRSDNTWILQQQTQPRQQAQQTHQQVQSRQQAKQQHRKSQSQTNTSASLNQQRVHQVQQPQQSHQMHARPQTHHQNQWQTSQWVQFGYEQANVHPQPRGQGGQQDPWRVNNASWSNPSR